MSKKNESKKKDKSEPELEPEEPVTNIGMDKDYNKDKDKVKDKDPMKMFFRLKKVGPEEEKKEYIEDALTFKMSSSGLDFKFEVKGDTDMVKALKKKLRIKRINDQVVIRLQPNPQSDLVDYLADSDITL